MSVDPEIDRVELDDRSTATDDQLDRSTQLLTLLSIQLDSRQRQLTRSIDFIDSIVDSLGLLHVAWPEWCALFVVYMS